MNKNARSARTIVFLGISGSGKGTQAARLLKVLPGSVNISTGKAFRRIASHRRVVGRCIRAIIRRGDVVPYWGPAYVWLNVFFERLRGDEHVVLDGGPRLIADARLLDDFMRDIGRSLPTAIYIVLSERAARRRLERRGRAIDDTPQAIRARFAYFRREVLPVVAYYRRRGRLVTINGEQPIQAVWRDIKRALRLA